MLDGGERSEPQIVPGVLPAQASRLDVGVEKSSHLGAALRLAAVVVFPAQHHVAHRLLDVVVVDGHHRIAQEDAQAVPQFISFSWEVGLLRRTTRAPCQVLERGPPAFRAGRAR